MLVSLWRRKSTRVAVVVGGCFGWRYLSGLNGLFVCLWNGWGGPPSGVVVESGGGEAGEVDRSSAGDEVTKHAGGASGSCFSSAVGAAGEVADFAFDFRAGCPIVGLPVRVGLISFGLLHARFVAGDGNGATSS